MAPLNVFLLMHELTMAGGSRLAASVFSALGDSVRLRIVANRSGALRDDFAGLGDLTVLREGLVSQASRRLLGPSQAQWAIEGFAAQAKSRLLRPGRPDVVYLNSVAALPIYARMPQVRRLECPGRLARP